MQSKQLNYHYQAHNDTLTINGIAYSGKLFRAIANGKLAEVSIKYDDGEPVLYNGELWRTFDVDKLSEVTIKLDTATTTTPTTNVASQDTKKNKNRTVSAPDKTE